MYTHMAHFVAKELHIRPSEILDTWNTAELLVAYGEFANQIAEKNYLEWENIYLKKQEGTPPPPQKLVVRFIGLSEMKELIDES